MPVRKIKPILELTKEQRLFNIQILWTRAYLHFKSLDKVGATLFRIVGAIADGYIVADIFNPEDQECKDFLLEHFAKDHPIMQHVFIER